MYESGIDIQKTFKNKRGYKSSRRSFKIYRLGEEELHLRDAKGDGDIIFEASSINSMNKGIWSSKASGYIKNPITLKLNLTKKEIIDYSDGDACYKEVINQSLRIARNEGYFDKIPLRDICNILDSSNIIMLDEDNTEWSGLLLGREGRLKANLASKENRGGTDATPTYTPYSNTILIMTWYKMPSGKYEIVVYVS